MICSSIRFRLLYVEEGQIGYLPSMKINDGLLCPLRRHDVSMSLIVRLFSQKHHFLYDHGTRLTCTDIYYNI